MFARRMQSVSAVLLLTAIMQLAASYSAVAASTPKADYCVAPTGNDENPGTVDRPFATIQRARDAVRKEIADGLSDDVRVVIRKGAYRLPEGLVFGIEDSAGREHSITYAAYPGEVPVLIGGVAVTGWKQHSGQIYVAELPGGVTGNQLFEGDRRLTLARAPNEGYFHLAESAEGSDRLAFVYRPADFDPAGWDISEARVNIWPYHDWFNHEYPIEGINRKKHIVTLGTNRRRLRPDNRYYIKNVLALLDEPGECCIFLNQRKVYVWPRKGRKGLEEITLATAESVIRIQGWNDRNVQNVHFTGLDIGICKDDAVVINWAENCSIRRCKIENAGVTGVVVSDYAQRIRIEDNLIRRHGQHGVSLTGRGIGQANVHHHNIVHNNHIHHCGRLIGHGYGVRVQQSGHNRITHNHIHHMPRYGTTIKGSRYGTIKGRIEGMTWENRYDFMHGRNNLFAYNDIHHTNLDSQDTGAMESWGAGRDNTFDHNLIHDTGNSEFNLQSGIYLDDQADYFTITNNIIYGVRGTSHNQCIYAKGIGNRVENNILIGNALCDTGIHSFFMADERCDHHQYLRNILYFADTPMPADHGSFGSGIGNLHEKGTTVTWHVDAPAADRYNIWVRYACANKPYNVDRMDGRFAVSADDGKSVTLNNLPDTGDWGRYEWAKASQIELVAGLQQIRLENLKGGGMNLDALVFCAAKDWRPEGVRPPETLTDAHVVTVQAESFTKKNGRTPPSYAYGFTNWSNDRVTASDYNVFYKPHGKVSIKGGPADGSLDKWRQILDQRFDQHSIVADPMFVDVEARDFRLRPDSPALKRGFKPIDTSSIGLTDNFPARFERE